MLIMQIVMNIITSDLRLVKHLLKMSKFHTLLLKKTTTSEQHFILFRVTLIQALPMMMMPLMRVSSEESPTSLTFCVTGSTMPWLLFTQPWKRYKITFFVA